MIDRVNKFAITIIAIITDRDFKNENFFSMCSDVTNLVISLEIEPIRCAILLCHFGRTRNSYIATRFILLSSAAQSSASNGYVVGPERFGQNEARASRKVERTKKKLSFVPSSQSIQCSM